MNKRMTGHTATMSLTAQSAYIIKYDEDDTDYVFAQYVYYSSMKEHFVYGEIERYEVHYLFRDGDENIPDEFKEDMEPAIFIADEGGEAPEPYFISDFMRDDFLSSTFK